MPPYTALTRVPEKRKSDQIDDENTIPRKRPSLDNQSVSYSKATYWTVQWRHPQQKKHKTWEGDGVLVLEGTGYSLFDNNGKSLGYGKHTLGRSLCSDDEISVGGKDVLIDTSLDEISFKAGTCFGSGGLHVPPSPPKASSFKPSASKFGIKGVTRSFVPLQPSNTNKSLFSTTAQSRLNINRTYPAATNHVDVRNFFNDEETSEAGGERENLLKGAKVQADTETLWAVTWRKSTTKKNKTWDGDGMLHQVGKLIKFLSEDGKKIHGSKKYDEALEVGSRVWLNEKEIQVVSSLPLSRLQGGNTDSIIDLSDNEEGNKQLEPTANARKFQQYVAPTVVKRVERQETLTPKAKTIGPLHAPDVDGAIVLKSPPMSHQQRYNSKNRPIVPVVLDPLLKNRLRPHQIEGVKFMYECVMGMSKHEGQGKMVGACDAILRTVLIQRSILGDEMGLGKTLQTITVIWTLLKQNPYAGTGPVIGKAMVVCPVSLIENWRKEFHKWIGRDRIGIFTGDRDKTAIKQFINSRNHQILIIGYERLRGVIQDLAYCNPPIGLIVCDEGHRLKAAGTKTTKMFEALKTPRRIILSGTPIQNDLSEFHAMADFCNPGLLDEYSTFKRVYETPILQSRMPDCSSKALELGTTRATQLQTIARSFVLRREATILSNYLPPKYEYVVFVTPTELQLSMMRKLLHPDELYTLASSTARSLALIQTLSKLCTSPYLLQKKNDNQNLSNGVKAAIALLPSSVRATDISLSGKLVALGNILRCIRQGTEEKCIIVSHYTSTLDIIESYCDKNGYSLFRLDGQTPPAKRQEYVDKFNSSTQKERFLFLLSAKAGGVGLNLIGASRLVLVDGDWNPSHDLQAMARIHRDGQKRPVFIYRLLTAGTIDEKIYQRQVTKIGLSDAMMGNQTSGSNKSKTDDFTSKDLRDIFNIYPDVSCHTHELLGCTCLAKVLPSSKEDSDKDSKKAPKFVEQDSDDEEIEMGFVLGSQVNPDKLSKAEIRRNKDALSSLSEWAHIPALRASSFSLIQDSILRQLVHKPPPTAASKGEVLDPETDDLWDSFGNEDELEVVDERETLVQDVPGGTMTFVFERVSKTKL